MTAILVRLGLLVGCLALAVPFQDQQKSALPDLKVGGTGPDRGEPCDVDFAACYPITSYYLGEGLPALARPTQADGSVRIGDLNGDKALDVVAAITYERGNFHAAAIAVLLNTGNGRFHPAQRFDAISGTFPNPEINVIVGHVALGYLNEDGALDAAVTCYGVAAHPRLVVMLNDGAGNFEALPPYTLPVGYPADDLRDIAVGDLSGDGLADIAIPFSDATPSTVAGVVVYRSVGDGSLDAPVTLMLPAGSRPMSVAIGDLDGSGLSDLAVAECGANCFGSPGEVSIFLNTTPADPPSSPLTFARTSIPAINRSLRRVALGDFDGDQALDIAAIEFQQPGSANGNYLFLVARNLGGGAFGPFQQFFTGGASDARGLDLGDFDGDGRLDAAIAHIDIAAGEPRPRRGVCIMQNVPVPNGLSFIPHTYGSPASPAIVAVGDLDGLNGPDLVLGHSISRSEGGSTVSTYFNLGDGTLRDNALYPVGNNTPGIINQRTDQAAADFDRDGWTDLVVAENYSHGLPDSVTVLRNSLGMFPQQEQYTRTLGSGVAEPVRVLAGDIDCTFGPDVVVLLNESLAPSNVVALVLRNDGHGVLGAAEPSITGERGVQDGALLDLDLDADLDLVILNVRSRALLVYLNNGEGQFALQGSYSTPQDGLSVAFGDFLNQDSRPDAAVVSRTRNVHLFANTIVPGGAGGLVLQPAVLSVPVLPGTGLAELDDVALTDLDGDTDLDLAVDDFPGRVFVFMNDGTGGFPAPPVEHLVPLTSGASTAFNRNQLASADINGDEAPELIVTSRVQDQVVVLPNCNDGTGALGRYQLYATNDQPIGLVLAELSNDGRADIAVANSNDCAVSILFNACGPGGPPPGPPDPGLRDCDGNLILDRCDLADGAPDCNGNGILDECDIAGGVSADVNNNGVPDECETLDLLVSAIDTSLLIADGQALTVSGDVLVRIENSGVLPAVDEFQVLLFDDRDGDGLFAPPDVPLGSAPQAGLAAGGNLVVSVPVTGTQVFRGDLIYAFIDSGAAISETDETNNYANSGQFCRSGPPGSETPVPDLTASFVRVEQDAVNGVRITARIGNGGAVAAPAGVGAAFFDGPPAGGLSLGTVSTAAVLAPGAYEDVTLTLPYGTETAGFVWVVADNTGAVIECDEANNAHNSGLQLVRPNLPPIAHAGGTYDALECAIVEFDGSASSDPDGDPLTFAWDLDGDGEFDDSTDPAPLRAYRTTAAVSTIEVRLIVSDGRVPSPPSAPATVTIHDATPTVTLTAPLVLDIGQVGVFEAYPAGPCDAITLVEWDWDFDGSTFAASGNVGTSQTHAYAAQGHYRVAARATDEDGSQATWTQQLRVVAPGGPRIPAGPRIEVVVGSRDYDSATQLHRGQFTLINRTERPIRGPIALALDNILPAQVTLLPADVSGVVPHPTETGRSIPYVDFSEFLTGGYLPAGGSAGPKWVHFAAPNNVAFTFDAMAYLFNAPPRFTSAPLLVAEEGRRYRHDVDAIDDDGDVVTYELVDPNGELAAAGMVIHPASGLIDWTPSQQSAPEYTVTVLARDGLEGGDAHQSFPTIHVGAVNVAPRITSPPRTTALLGEDYSYPLSVEDEDGDIATRTFALPIAPAGMIISSTGLIEWLPPQVGNVAVLVEVDDGHGHQAVQSYVLTVLACADPPAIEPTPFPSATEGQFLEYQVVVDNPGGQTLTYSLPVAPDGMTISPTGRIRWTPSFTQAGPRIAKIVAALSPDCFDERIATIDVDHANAAPRFTSQPNPMAVEGSVYRYSALATDDDDEAVTYRLIQGPDGMTMHPLTGEVQWVISQTAAAAAPYTVVLAAVDPQESVGQQSYTLGVTGTNVGPQIISIPNYVAVEAEPYEYQVIATDVDSSIPGCAGCTYSISPFELTIDANGLVQWTPDQQAAQRNPHRIAITVRDAGGLEYTQGYELFVRAVNVAPVMNPIPDATIAEGELFTCTISATDADGDVLTFALAPDAPPGMSIVTTPEPQSDRIEWQVPQTAAAASPYVIAVTASDNTPATSPPDSFQLTVTSVNVPPVFDPVSPAALQGGTDSTYRYTVHATDPDGGQPPRYELVPGEHPAAMVIDDQTGEITWDTTGVSLGDHPVAVLALDPENLFDRLDYTIIVTECATRPQFFSTPRTTARVDSPLPYLYDANAIAPDGADVTYSLAVRPDPDMNIDPISGLLTWSPTTAGVYRVVVAAARSDNLACTSEQPFDIDVRDTCSIELSYDLPPLSPGDSATFTPIVVASCGGEIEFTLESIPPASPVTFDSETGVIRWTPVAGPFEFVVRATDAWDASDTFAIEGLVEGHNPPRFAFSPVRRAVAGFPYVCRVRATDIDGSPLTFALNDPIPSGMTVVLTGPNAAEIHWTPGPNQLGDHEVTVVVADDNQPTPLTDTLTFVIEVADATDADIRRPEVAVHADPLAVDPGQPVTLIVTAVDDYAVQSLALTVNGEPLPLDPDGHAIYTPAQPGTYIAVATAMDIGRNTAHATTDFRARFPGDDVPPQVAIDPLAPEGIDAEITAPTGLRGHVEDDNLHRYTLAYRQPGQADFVIFHTGYQSVVDGGVLGIFDPSLLLNGLYEIRLQAEDLNGNRSEAEISVAVTGNLKVGNFTVSFTDLSIPVSGIPITITRTYDSRDKTMGDFGVGWRMELASLRTHESRVLGNNWKQLRIAGFFPTFILQPVRDPIVSLTMPDGRVERFRMTPVPSQQLVYPIEHLDGLVFTSIPPTTGTLEVLSGAPNEYVGTLPVGGVPGEGNIVNTDDGGPTYDPTTYLYTRRDGTELYFTGAAGSRTARLQRIRDRVGNELTFTANAVTSSTGKSVQLDRDAEGRIERIIDPNGAKIRFEYDAAGNLARSFAPRRDGEPLPSPTEYDYDGRHNLVDIRNPLGISAQRNEYDEDGRLIAVYDANGHGVEFTHDLAGQQEIVEDARGNLARYVYDAEGNVTLEEKAVTIDGTPAFARTERTYDSNGNELTRIDPDGLRRNREYEADACSVCTEDYTYEVIDPHESPGDAHLNIETHNSYDGFGNLIQTIDALGRFTTTTYNNQGSPARIEMPGGAAFDTVYNFQTGDPLVMTEPSGSSTHNTYSHDGYLTRQERRDADGARLSLATYTYDSNGNRRTDSVERTIEGNLVTLTTTYEYDASNRVTRVTDPHGRVSRTDYNDAGQKVADIRDAGPGGLNQRTEYEYDDAGRQTLTRFPDGTTRRTEYDEVGNVLREFGQDAAHPPTEFEYDELNRRVKTTYPDGSFSRTIHSPGGRVVAEIDRRGNRTDYEYDTAGRQTAVVLPAVFDYNTGETVRPRIAHEYDVGGNRTATIDANGRRTQFFYDAANRLVRTRFHNGSEQRRVYDAASRLIEEIDQAGRSKHYDYDGAGRLLAVTLPPPNPGDAAPITRYSYDEAGNQLTQTDALGRVTRFGYDELGRRVKRTLPLGMFETSQYDTVGNLAAHTDFNGDTIRYFYDGMNRLVRKELPVGSAGAALDGLQPVPPSASDRTGAGLFVLNREQTQLTVTYQTTILTAEITAARLRRGATGSAGPVVFELPIGQEQVTTTIAVTAPQVAELLAGGWYIEVATPAFPTGEIRGQITALTPGVVTYTYTPTGQRDTVTDDRGVTDYDYDENDRVVRIDQPFGDGRAEITYTWDAAGNRLSITHPAQTVNYEYDALNRLSRVLAPEGTYEYQYDAAGNRRFLRMANNTTTEWQYDTLNRLTHIYHRNPAGEVFASYIYTLDVTGKRIRVDEFPTRSVDYAYDGMDRLIRETMREGDGSVTTIAYTYDAVGNRLRRVIVGPTQTMTTEYEYDENDRLLIETQTTQLARVFPGEDAAKLCKRADRFDPPSQVGGYVLGGVLISEFLLPLLAFSPFNRGSGLLGRGTNRRRRYRQSIAWILLPLMLLSTETFLRLSSQAQAATMAAMFGPRATTYTYAYDANGAQLVRSDGADATRCTFDSRGRLVAVGVSASARYLTLYNYNDDQDRVSRASDASADAYLVDGHNGTGFSQVIEERDQSSANDAAFVIGDDLLARASADGTDFYGVDGQSSTRSLTNSSGNPAARWSYDGFGNLLTHTASSGNDFLYAGERFDTASGFYHLRSRSYSPQLGRFVSLDDFAGFARRPHSLHKYVYAEGDPGNKSDPSGHTPLIELLIAGAIVGGLATMVVNAAIHEHRSRADRRATLAVFASTVRSVLLSAQHWIEQVSRIPASDATFFLERPLACTRCPFAALSAGFSYQGGVVRGNIAFTVKYYWPQASEVRAIFESPSPSNRPAFTASAPAAVVPSEPYYTMAFDSTPIQNVPRSGGISDFRLNTYYGPTPERIEYSELLGHFFNYPPYFEAR